MFFSWSINSSKVYCKLNEKAIEEALNNGINSSKVYCKLTSMQELLCIFLVLIVAKCIVNSNIFIKKLLDLLVLIVAKCIVNNGVGKNTGKTAEY